MQTAFGAADRNLKRVRKQWITGSLSFPRPPRAWVRGYSVTELFYVSSHITFVVLCYRCIVSCLGSGGLI